MMLYRICVACSVGALSHLPKFTSQKVRQLADSADMKAYNDLATAYNNKNSDKLARVADQHMATFNAVGTVCPDC